MWNSTRIMVTVAVLFTATTAVAKIFSIPAEQADSGKVYWGTTSGFEKAGEMNYERILKATPEYKELKKDKVERGTGKYWILMSQASDRTNRAISQVGQESDYDLIAVQGYLGNLQPAIPAADITDLILDELKKSASAGDRE